jgi:hypothetical protein
VTTATAAIESECEFLQVRLQMIGRDRPLVCAQDPSFVQTGDTMHAGQVSPDNDTTVF